MKAKWSCSGAAVVLLAMAVCLPGSSFAKEAKESSHAWREKAVEYAHILSRVKWTPVAKECRSGVALFRRGPYTEFRIQRQSGGTVHRLRHHLKTFLAAVESPSVLYTEAFPARFPTPRPTGTVCSTFTSHALQCQSLSKLAPRPGVPQRRRSRRAAIGSGRQARRYHLYAACEGRWRFSRGTRDGGRKERWKCNRRPRRDSWPHPEISFATLPTSVPYFIRRPQTISGHHFTPGASRARRESFLFRTRRRFATPAINRVLLLDRGDWVPYFKDQAVKFNVMDKDSKGVQSLVIKRGDTVVEQIAVRGGGVIERLLSDCGDYTAHCVMSDGSLSPACEFSVCDLGFSLPAEAPARGKPWEITFSARNLSVIGVHLMNPKPPYDRYCVWLTEQDRRREGDRSAPAGSGSQAACGSG